MSKLSIRTEKKNIPISKNLYGIFLEDINRAVDGGLYPEMIRNRTFEDSILPCDCKTEDNGYSLVTATNWHDEFNNGEGLSRWVRNNKIAETPIPAWYADHAEMTLDTADTLNPRRQTALSISFAKGGSVYNTGFCGMAQNEGDTYALYFFAKADTPTKLIVSITDGGTICAGSECIVGRKEYSRYNVMLKAVKDSSTAKFEIACPEGGRVKLGFISLMPTDTYMGHGFRKDITKKLKDMNPRFFRFPGGCIVEGISPSTAMRFHNTVGPVWERPGHLLMWHYRTYNGLGFHEFLQLCEDLDMEPLYVFNCGMTCQGRMPVLMEGRDLEDMIQDTLDALEYALGPANSVWGAVRAQMGHPAPFKMNYLEIGNENSGPDYEKRYARCYDEIKKRYPWIKCIANTHVEKHNLPVEIVDEHYYDTAEFFAESAEMFAAYDRKGPEIFLGEVAVIRGYVGQLYGALAEAAFFTGVERNQDLVTLVSYAPLLENTNYNAWFPNLVIFNNSGSYGIPSYYVWKLFGNNRGEFIVETREETGKIYRPLKGMASLLGAGGLVFKNALWNGKKAEITHELMGTIAETAGTYTVQEPDDAQKKEARGFYGINPEDVFVIFGEEDISSGVFEIDIRADKDREIIIGIFSSRIPKEVYISDETNPPKAWNPGNVRPFLWKLSGGKSTLTEKKFMENPSLDNEKTVILRQGEFNHFQYMTDGKRLSLYANGELIHAIDIPSFRSLHTVVSDTASEIIIKTVNMADREDDVSIELDCDVRDEYRAYALTGGKEAENSFDNPQNVHDELFNLHGAARKFTYRAPPFSVNVLRLIKNPDANGGHGR